MTCSFEIQNSRSPVMSWGKVIFPLLLRNFFSQTLSNPSSSTLGQDSVKFSVASRSSETSSDVHHYQILSFPPKPFGNVHPTSYRTKPKISKISYATSQERKSIQSSTYQDYLSNTLERNFWNSSIFQVVFGVIRCPAILYPRVSNDLVRFE